MITRFDKTTQDILTDLEQTQREFWNVARVSAEFMYILIKEEKIQNAIEIGTSNGYSGIWLGKHFRKQADILQPLNTGKNGLALPKKTSKNAGWKM